MQYFTMTVPIILDKFKDVFIKMYINRELT